MSLRRHQVVLQRLSEHLIRGLETCIRASFFNYSTESGGHLIFGRIERSIASSRPCHRAFNFSDATRTSIKPERLHTLITASVEKSGEMRQERRHFPGWPEAKATTRAYLSPGSDSSAQMQRVHPHEYLILTSCALPLGNLHGTLIRPIKTRFLKYLLARLRGRVRSCAPLPVARCHTSSLRLVFV